MALLQADKILDTLIEMIERERSVYNTIIDRYFEGRSLNIFLGRRISLPASSLPAIEVTNVSTSIGWHACRVQEENPSIEIDITTDNGHPEQAVRLEAQLVTLTTRILASPPHLRPLIKGSNVWMYDSLPSGVRYGTAEQGRMRVATISWSGKNLEYISNRLLKYMSDGLFPVDHPPY